jgi:hypothetical protein
MRRPVSKPVSYSNGSSALSPGVTDSTSRLQRLHMKRQAEDPVGQFNRVMFRLHFRYPATLQLVFPPYDLVHSPSGPTAAWQQTVSPYLRTILSTDVTASTYIGRRDSVFDNCAGLRLGQCRSMKMARAAMSGVRAATAGSGQVHAPRDTPVDQERSPRPNPIDQNRVEFNKLAACAKTE